MQIQKESPLTIDGYLREQKIKLPQDIVMEVHKEFIDYKWSNTTINDCNQSQFKDISVLCAQLIHNRIDIEK